MVGTCCALTLILVLMFPAFHRSWTLAPYSASRHFSSSRAARRYLSQASSADTQQHSRNTHNAGKLVILAESTWRRMASEHAVRLHSILQPGLLKLNLMQNPVEDNRSSRRKRDRVLALDQEHIFFTALDPNHPVYNFLINYYGRLLCCYTLVHYFYM